MSSLIITIVSVLLVAALALAALLYTGSASDQAGAKADAAKYLNQGQQLLGAADLYKSDKGEWPLSIDQLRTGKYLSAEVIGVKDIKWSMPIAGNPTFVLTDVQKDSCKQVNSLAYKVEGVFSKLSAAYVAQCYSPESSAFTVVVTKGAAYLTDTGTCPPGNTAIGKQGLGLGAVLCNPVPVNDCDSTEWSVKPKHCEAPSGGPPPTPTNPSNGALFQPGVLTYAFDKGQVSEMTRVSLKNTGSESFGPSNIVVSNPDYSFYIMPNCNDELQPGDTCEIEVMAYGNNGGQATANVTVEKNGTTLGSLPMVIQTGNVVLANKGSTTKLDELRLPSTMANIATSKVFSAVNRGTAPAPMPAFYGNQTFVTPAPDCPSVLAPGAACDVTVSSSASWEGSVWNSIYSATEFNGSESYYAIFENLPSELVLSTTYLDFGTVGVNRAKTLDVLVSNSSASSTTIMVPASTGAFSIEHNCPTSLGPAGSPSDSCSMSITFRPLDVGGFGETLYVQTSLGAATLNVTGQGVPEKPLLEFVSIDSDNAPYITYFEPMSLTPERVENTSVRLKNVGFGDAEVSFEKSESTLYGRTPGSDAFTFTHDCPQKLAEGAYCTINLTIEVMPYSPYRTLELTANYPNAMYEHGVRMDISLYPKFLSAPTLTHEFGVEEIEGVGFISNYYVLKNTTNSTLRWAPGGYKEFEIDSANDVRIQVSASGAAFRFERNGVKSCTDFIELYPAHKCLIQASIVYNDPKNLAPEGPYVYGGGFTVKTTMGDAHRPVTLNLWPKKNATTGSIVDIEDSGPYWVEAAIYARKWTFTARATNNGPDQYVYVSGLLDWLSNPRPNGCRKWLRIGEHCEVTFILGVDDNKPPRYYSPAELMNLYDIKALYFSGALDHSTNGEYLYPNSNFDPADNFSPKVSPDFQP